MGVDTKTVDEESPLADNPATPDKTNASTDEKPDEENGKSQTENGKENAADDGEGEETKTGYQPLFIRNAFMCRCLITIIIIAILLLIALIVLLLTPSLQKAYNIPKMHVAMIRVPENLQTTAPFDVPRNLTIPKGFAIEAYASVPSARFLLSLPGGDVLVSQPREGKISLLKPPATENVSAIRTDFTTGLLFPQDMVLYNDENSIKYIYVAEANRVTRHFYEEGDTRLRTAQVIVSNLPYAGDDENPYKGIAVGNRTLYVSIGSATDSNPEELKSSPKRGVIYGYLPSGGQRRLISEGIRSAEGLAIVPGTTHLWAVVKQRSGIQYPFKGDKYGILDNAFVDYNPPEELIHVVEGENYGWPYCNPNFQISKGHDIKYVADVETNADEEVVKCSSFRKIDYALPPHTVPLGLTFWSGEHVPEYYDGGGLIALSEFNSKTNEGNSVYFVSGFGGKPLYSFDLVKGWVLNSETKERWGKPIDTAVLEDGSVLISDEIHGAIYRLYKKD